MLVQITGKLAGRPFCAGAVLENEHVVFAAPILRRTIGWHRSKLLYVFRCELNCEVEPVW